MMVSEARCRALEKRVFDTLGADFEVSRSDVGDPSRCVIDLANRELKADYPDSPLHYMGAIQIGPGDHMDAQIPYPNTWDWEEFINELNHRDFTMCQFFDHVPALEVEMWDFSEDEENELPDIETPTMFLVADCAEDASDLLLRELKRWTG